MVLFGMLLQLCMHMEAISRLHTSIIKIRFTTQDILTYHFAMFLTRKRKRIQKKLIMQKWVRVQYMYMYAHTQVIFGVILDC